MKEEDLESPLLSDGGEPTPAPAPNARCSAYALVCALLASLTSIIYGYSKRRRRLLRLSFFLPRIEMVATSPSPPGRSARRHRRLRRDERGAEVRAGGPGRHGRAARGAHRRHQRLLPRRLAGDGLDVRPRGPPPRRRHLRRHVPRRVRRHRRRRRVRRAHGRAARRRRRLRVRPRRRARLHHRDRAGELAGVPLLHPRDRLQLGHLAQLHRRLRARGPPTTLNWRLMIGIGAVPPLFLAAAAMLAMPETPRWLVLHGHPDEARRVLARTTGNAGVADRRLQEFVASVRDASKNAAVSGGGKSSSTGVWGEILLRPTRAVRRVMLAIVGLQVFQQACGVAALLLYVPRVFSHVGITSERAVLGATVLLGAVKTVAVVVPLFLDDRLGRRPMLLSSAGGMAASLLVLGLSLRAPEASAAASWWAATTCVAGAAAFMAAFSLGFGPVIWMYGSEILPLRLRLRAQGTGIATAVNRVMSAFMGMTFISMYEAVGMAGSFYILAALSVAAWVFVYAFLPETKGRSLEEMETLFDAGAKPSPPAALS